MCISCGLLPDTGPIQYQILYVKNNTSNSIEITGFYKGRKIGLEPIKIEPNSEFQILNKYLYPINIFPNWDVDSISLKTGNVGTYAVYCNGENLSICKNEKYKFLFSRYTEQPTNEKINNKRIKMKYFMDIKDSDINLLK
ncbi:hypothetical protein EMA8858_04112 [Emticicia aquatica]|uniref:Uncharacterized protein n=1 Tax=Emticicia aquatica TaxID=1681835 RepID=A0ABN8EXX3_9BACT|nr:hypothetical protein EMA8858_04112 [Emticicia aquatica]